jgi:outer membrane lipoprotein SlyB
MGRYASLLAGCAIGGVAGLHMGTALGRSNAATIAPAVVLREHGPDIFERNQMGQTIMLS